MGLCFFAYMNEKQTKREPSPTACGPAALRKTVKGCLLSLSADKYDQLLVQGHPTDCSDVYLDIRAFCKVHATHGEGWPVLVSRYRESVPRHQMGPNKTK